MLLKTIPKFLVHFDFDYKKEIGVDRVKMNLLRHIYKN